MKKKFVARKPINEASASGSLRPTKVIMRKDYLFNVNPGERFWFPTGDVMTMQESKYLGVDNEWFKFIAIKDNGDRVEVLTHSSSYAVSIECDAECVVGVGGKLFSACRWSNNSRSNWFGKDHKTTLLAVYDPSKKSCQLIEGNSKVIESIEVL